MVLWRDVLNPAYAVSELFFETARRGVLRAFFRTWWQSLRPGTLWRGAQMQFAVHPARLACFVVLGVALMWMLGAGVLMGTEYIPRTRWWGWTSPRWYQWPQLAIDAIWPNDLFTDQPPRFPRPWLAAGWAWLLGAPLLLKLVPQTLQKARVRPSHIVRIWAYSFVGLPLLAYGPCLGNRTLLLCPWLSDHLRLPLQDHPGLTALALLALWGGWIVACWGAAAKHYLRLERPWTVAITLVFLGGLAVVTLAVLGAGVSAEMMAWMMNELR